MKLSKGVAYLFCYRHASLQANTRCHNTVAVMNDPLQGAGWPGLSGAAPAGNESVLCGGLRRVARVGTLTSHRPLVL